MSDEHKDDSHLSSADLAGLLKQKIKKALDADNTAGIAKDISALRKLEKEIAADAQVEEHHQAEQAAESGIPERLKIKRPYRMSAEALNARRRNARNSTGPQTTEGKFRSSRNEQVLRA